MTTRPDPRLKSLASLPWPRRTGPARHGGQAPKVVAEGVRVALRPDPHAVTVTGIQPGLSVRGLGRNELPVADWVCACGHHERARGRRAVTELTTRATVQQCPQTTTTGRAAA
ncbi:hypothetical protein AB0M42_00680 [Streptomyces sp. NPDC051784]|uniref:hypothetical protein n=1 Tax=Streptomyces sp. NPDC051784 TaxID=3155805 RepID=UPI0034497228